MLSLKFEPSEIKQYYGKGKMYLFPTWKVGNILGNKKGNVNMFLARDCLPGVLYITCIHSYSHLQIKPLKFPMR